VKEQKHPTEEAFDARAFAQLLSGPGGREAGAILLPLGIPGDDCHGSQHTMDPSDEAQAPIAGIQPDDARTDVVEANGPLKPRLGEGGIMDVGRGEQKEDGQTRPAAQQRVDTLAPQEWSRMMGWSVSDSGIGVGSLPGQDGSAIDDQIACANHAAAHGTPDREHEGRLKGRRSCRRPSFRQLGRAGDAWLAIGPLRQATGQGQRGPTLQPVMDVPGRESRQSVLSKAISRKDSSR